MKVTIFTGSDELDNALTRYLFFVINENIVILHAKLGNPETLDIEMKDSDLWLIEAVNPKDIANPEGFRVAKQVADKIHTLVLFIGINSNVPSEGNFWIKIPSKKLLSQKLKEIMENNPPKIDEFEVLEERVPWLKSKPSHHGHHG